MQWAGNEFPERLEILEHGAAGIVAMRGRVVHVGGEPDDIAHAGTLDEGEQIGDLMLAPVRRTVAERDGILAEQPDRQVGRDDFPGRIRCHQFALQPGKLRGAEDARALSVARVPAGVAIAAHVEQEDVEQRAVRYLAIDSSVLHRNIADRHEFVKGAAGARHQQRAAVLGIA